MTTGVAETSQHYSTYALVRRLLLDEALGYWPRYAVAFLLMGIAAAATALTAYLLGTMTNEAYVNHNFHGIVVIGVVATAIFANSPFTEGKPNGFLSFRSEIWRDTDLDRTGMLPFAFEAGMGFERYVDYALSVPMYFVKRGAEYIDVAGSSFRDLLAGKHPALPGERATISDWANHLSTLFPEVRLKRYLEMRGADDGPRERICALSALWTGLLYDRQALDAAWDLVKGWNAEERQTLRDEVPRLGFNAAIRERKVRELARDMISLARDGLKRRRRLDYYSGDDESDFLDPIEEIVESGETPAEGLLARFRGEWSGSVEPAFEALKY